MSNQITGLELKARRLAAGLAQEKLARLADCTTRSVGLLESGYTPGQSRVRDRIVRVLDELDAAAGQGDRATTTHVAPATTSRKGQVVNDARSV